MSRQSDPPSDQSTGIKNVTDEIEEPAAEKPPAEKRKRGGRQEPPGGRPRFVPSKALREDVLRFASFGLSHEDICKLVVNPNTGKRLTARRLRAHFQDELRTATLRADARVVGALFAQACGRPAEYDAAGNVIRKEVKPDTVAQIWWTKARPNLRWSERVETRHTGHDGGVLKVVFETLDAVGEFLKTRGIDAQRVRPPVLVIDNGPGDDEKQSA